MQETDIAIIVETKTQKPPNIDGYNWYHKPRRGRTGGGVGILVKQTIFPNTQEVNYLRHENHEILWIKINTKYRPTFIGAYYGPQESEERNNVYREYQEIATTLSQLKQEGDIILAGDFNAKINTNSTAYPQEESRNGSILKQIVEETDMTILNINDKTIKWTRENRNNNREKSIIDYVLCNKPMQPNIKDLTIDDTGTLTIRGTKPSDHNTISLTVQRTQQKCKSQTRKKWAPGNTTSWQDFNKKLEKLQHKCADYNTLEKAVLESLHNDVGIITIRGDGRTKETKEIKELRREKRDTKKQIQEKKKTNSTPEDILELNNKYQKIRKKLKTHIAAQIEITSKLKMQRLAQEGGSKSQNFWKIRKRLLKGNPNYDNQIVTENDRTIRDPNEIKEHIADYYENLYQAREGNEKYREWTRNIESKIANLRHTTQKDRIEPFTLKELDNVITKLQKNKATGPDTIPNTVFTEASRNTRRLYLKIFNQITATKTVPKQWQHGEVIRIYKGKGTRGKCSNERGIALSSNVGKVYERLLNNRILKEIEISSEQAGGRKGACTTDHILRIKELIRRNKANKKNTYITFLDVTKAYDKAWLDAIMYVMEKQGCKGAIWNLTDKLNQDLKATIRTTLGNTRPITIRNSIRQGGVLAVTQYATLMDEINKEIIIAKHKPDSRIDEDSTCLLWVDDVALITNNILDQKILLKITEETASKYRIQFGQEKSKTLTIGTKQDPIELKTDNIIIKPTDQYKYLGEIISNKNNINKHIEEIEKKTEAALQSTFLIAGDENFRAIQMDTIWTILETCIIPIITNGCETWENNKSQNEKLNRILDNIIKRLLRVPQTTPRESIYKELNILDIEHRIMEKRILYYKKLRDHNPHHMRKILNDTNTKSWAHKTQLLITNLEMNGEQLKEASYHKAKMIVRKKIKTHMDTKLEHQGQKKSKFIFLTQHKKREKDTKPLYLKWLTRDQARAIFMARTRMITAKGNYKNKHGNPTCRGCGLYEETQHHILEECQKVLDTGNQKISIQDIFATDLRTNRTIANKLNLIYLKLKIWEEA